MLTSSCKVRLAIEIMHRSQQKWKVSENWQLRRREVGKWFGKGQGEIVNRGAIVEAVCPGDKALGATIEARATLGKATTQDSPARRRSYWQIQVADLFDRATNMVT